MPLNPTRKYHNIMEDLVAEEVKRQVASLSPRLSQYIKRVEVETYALNRLPPLYASSQEGLLQQQKRGREILIEEVKKAVRQALVAVQRDVLRHSTPLIPDEDPKPQPAPSANSEQEELQHNMAAWRHSRYYRLNKNNYNR